MKLKIILIFLVAMAVSCNQESASNKTQSSEAENYVKIREIADLWFHHSAEMQACYLQSYKLAQLALDKQLADYKGDKTPAVVLDLDETVLDNSPYQLKLLEEKEEFSSESWNYWCNLAKAEALPGVSNFLNYAKEKGVEVFYISNRSVELLEGTVKNLQNLNLPNADTIHVLLKEKTGDKTERRNKVSENHEIIILVGDNLTDMSQEFADRNKETMGKEVVEKNKELFGTKYIILPNPMYGEWEKAIYNNSRKWSDSQKDSLRNLVIKSGY
jgi:5'-nucleotidase (lipoprotein e(P4) family)